MYCEELREGRWKRLHLGGELLKGRAHHIIYFGSRDDWKMQPEWAQDRRDEIVDSLYLATQDPEVPGTVPEEQ
jgi:hypothetical protein